MTPDEADDLAIRHLGRQALAATAAWIKAWYGERCLEYSENCTVCERWKAFDELFTEDDFDELDLP